MPTNHKIIAKQERRESSLDESRVTVALPRAINTTGSCGIASDASNVKLIVSSSFANVVVGLFDTINTVGTDGFNVSTRTPHHATF